MVDRCGVVSSETAFHSPFGDLCTEFGAQFSLGAVTRPSKREVRACVNATFVNRETKKPYTSPQMANESPCESARVGACILVLIEQARLKSEATEPEVSFADSSSIVNPYCFTISRAKEECCEALG